MKGKTLYIGIAFMLFTGMAFGSPQWLEELPASQVRQLISYEEDENYHFQQSFQRNNQGIRVEMTAPDMSRILQCDNDLHISYFQVVIEDEEMIQEDKLRSIEIMPTGNGRHLLITENHRGRIKEDQLELENSLDMSLLPFYLEGSSRSGDQRSDFTLLMFTAHAGRIFEMDFTRSNFQGSQKEEVLNAYDYPEELQSLFQEVGAATVYCGYLSGIAKTFYPHPFYYLLDEENNVRLEWGGPEDEAYFIEYR